MIFECKWNREYEYENVGGLGTIYLKLRVEMHVVNCEWVAHQVKFRRRHATLFFHSMHFM